MLLGSFDDLVAGLFCTMSSGLPGLFQDIARAVSFIRVKFWRIKVFTYIRILYTLSSLVHCLLPSFLQIYDHHTLCFVVMRFQGIPAILC